MPYCQWRVRRRLHQQLNREVVKNVQFTKKVAAPSEDEQKEELIAQLAELDVKADKRSSVEKLQEKLDEALAK